MMRAHRTTNRAKDRIVDHREKTFNSDLKIKTQIWIQWKHLYHRNGRLAGLLSAPASLASDPNSLSTCDYPQIVRCAPGLLALS